MATYDAGDNVATIFASFRGSQQSNTIDGGTAIGGSADDLIVGSNPTAQFRTEANPIPGGPPVNYTDYSNGNDFLEGRDGNDSMVGNQGNDQMWGQNGNDTMSGNVGTDTLSGGASNDSMNGNQDADNVSGDDGNDSTYGGQGADTIYGGTGNDFLSGDAGNDILNGGSGADTFFAINTQGYDVAQDFNYAEGDRMHIASGTTGTAYQSGADTIYDMGGGNVLVLAGVNMASLGPDWAFY